MHSLGARSWSNKFEVEFQIVSISKLLLLDVYLKDAQSYSLNSVILFHLKNYHSTPKM